MLKEYLSEVAEEEIKPWHIIIYTHGKILWQAIRFKIHNRSIDSLNDENNRAHAHCTKTVVCIIVLPS